MSEPLDKILACGWADFVPRHPERPPWLPQDVSVPYTMASTGNVAVVDLAVADRVELRGLGPSDEQDALEPGDWARSGWTPAA